MNNEKNLRALDDQKLLAATTLLVQKEKFYTHQILLHLLEINNRKLFSDLKYPSLFKYLTKELKYSDAEAAIRVSAMRLMRHHPLANEKLQSGELGLSQAAALQVALQTKGQQTQASTQTVIAPETIQATITSILGKNVDESKKIINQQLDLPAKVVVKITLTADLIKKLQRLKKIFGEEATELEIISALVEDKLKNPGQFTGHQETALNGSSETLQHKDPTRYISIHDRREVWQHAGGRCENCNSTVNLEYEHVQPFALGGTNERKNLKLLCKSCNLRAAIKVFGAIKINQYLQS